MPVVAAVDESTAMDGPATALHQVRQALALVVTDPSARALLAPRPASTAALADWLYARWWCGPGLRSTARTAAGDPSEPARGAARLEAARRMVAARSGGWLVLAAAGDLLVAARLSTAPTPGTGGALSPHVRSGSAPAVIARRQLRTSTDAVVSSSRPGRPARPGDLVTLRHGSAGLDPAGAWWWAHTGRPEDLADVPLDRWYVHARDLTAAVGLVPLLLAATAEAGCEVSLKCPPTQAGYGRRDALVVYLPRASAGAAEAALLRRADAVDGLVDPDVPPLTRLILPGVSRAEDPGQPGPTGADPAIETDAEVGISYGQLRCSQVAAAVTRLLGDGAGPTVGSASAISDVALAAELARVGIDLDAPERVSA